jgi:hypothetical protein
VHDAETLVVARVGEDIVETGPDKMLNSALAGDLEDLDAPIGFVLNAEGETVKIDEDVRYIFEGRAEIGFRLAGADVEEYV